MAGNSLYLCKHPDLMTDAELVAELSGKPDSVVMRSLLFAEIEAVRAGAEREERTMRNLWYDIVKPALSRAGLLNLKTAGGKGDPIPWDRKLSVYLAELVRGGETSYEELQIIDGSRQRQAAVAIMSTVAEVQLVGPHFPWVILFTEKDTIWRQVEAVAQLYGVSAISGGGQPSNACTENTVRAIVRSEAFRRAHPERMVILSLTDYDPSGYSIAESQVVQVQEAIDSLDPGERGALRGVEAIRLGLLPEQVEAAVRQMKAYEPKDKGLDEWYSETGGVDGQRLGLELDALPLSRLRAMFAEGIEQYVDMGKRRADLREAFVDLVIYQTLQPETDGRVNAMRRTVKGNGLWAAIGASPIPDNLFRRAAVGGYNAIDPIEFGLFIGYREALAEALG